MGFTKLDSGIIDSSIWEESADVLKVFITFWAKSKPDGTVSATYNSLLRTSNLHPESFKRSIDILLSSDPGSRSQEHEGRRIIRVEESKWLIVNYKKYREFTYSDNPEAVKKRKQRAKVDTTGDVSQNVPGHSASASLSASASMEEEFNDFRKHYPGKRRSFETELSDFKKKHKDWKEIIPLLTTSLNKQKKERDISKSINEFVPEWKNLKTWLYQRCWEEESDPHSSNGKPSGQDQTPRQPVTPQSLPELQAMVTAVLGKEDGFEYPESDTLKGADSWVELYRLLYKTDCEKGELVAMAKNKCREWSNE